MWRSAFPTRRSWRREQRRSWRPKRTSSSSLYEPSSCHEPLPPHTQHDLDPPNHHQQAQFWVCEKMAEQTTRHRDLGAYYPRLMASRPAHTPANRRSTVLEKMCRDVARRYYTSVALAPRIRRRQRSAPFYHRREWAGVFPSSEGSLSCRQGYKLLFHERLHFVPSLRSHHERRAWSMGGQHANAHGERRFHARPAAPNCRKTQNDCAKKEISVASAY